MRSVAITSLFGICLSIAVHGQSYVMTNGTVNDCSGTFFDSGGSGGNYGNNESFVFTICPDNGNGSGGNTSVEFQTWMVQGGVGDQLTIHNGATTAAPVIATGNGSNSLLGQTFTASGASGCLTFEWVSNGSGTDSGWEAIIVSGPVAGTDGATSTCSNAPPFGLFGFLGGSPDFGGTWTDPSATPHSGVFDPASDPAGVYTYTVSGGSGCNDVTATVTVTVVDAPDAGVSGSVSVCESDGNVGLFTILGGTPDLGGSWTAPGGGAHSGIFDPLTDSPGAYTYTVAGVAPCANASSVVNVSLFNDVDAGSDGSITICSDDGPFSLFAQLGGSPDPGGTWTDPNNNAHPVTYTPGSSIPGVYTYFIPGPGPCDDDSAQVTVVENTAPNAGISDVVTLCSDDAPLDMFAELGGTPDPGGVWTDDNAVVVTQFFDPGNDTPGVFTYTVAGAAPCVDAVSSITVNVNTTPDAGESNTIDICSDASSFQLLDSLSGTPQVSGSWTDPNSDPFPGTYTPGTSIPGVYTYTVTGVAPCSDDVSTLTVNQSTAPNAGISSSIVICSDEVGFDLFDELGGSPDLGGTWTDPVGNPYTDPINPAVALSGVYTYTVLGPGACDDDMATVSVTVNQAPSAGSGSVLDLCSDDPIMDLITALSGSPDPGGTWTGPGGGNVSGQFDPSVDQAGDYTYTVDGIAPCSDDQAVVTVNVTVAPDAGQNGTVSVCSDGPIIPLFNELGGSPDAGGDWFRPNGTPFNGNYDPSVGNGGVFTYVVQGSGPCENDTATVLVVRNVAPIAGVPGSITACSTTGQFNLFPVLGGNPNNTGSWLDPNNDPLPSGVFTPGVDTPGLYTYVVPGAAPCINDTSTVQVVVNAAPDAGTNVNITICGADAPFSLFDELGGSPDAGGTWVGPGGGSHGVIYNPVVDGTGGYTYTVPGIAPCASASASVFVQEVDPASAGTDASITVCESDPPVVLIDQLGSGPDMGGSWSNPGGSPFGSVFNPATDTPGDYDYTVAGTPPCSDSIATVSITVLPSPLSGGPGSFTACEDVPQIDLFNILVGAFDLGGSWSDDDATGQLSGSILVPSGLTPGDYDFTYTVNGNGNCSDQSTTVTVTIVASLNAGQNTTTPVCGNEPNYLLFNDLNGNPQSGGTWTDNGGTGALVNGTLNTTLLTAGSYQFTYILAGSAGCPSDSAVLTVNVIEEPNAGVSDNYSICSSTTAGVNMTNELAGTPDPGGVWTDDLGSPHSNIYNPQNDDSGVYTYTVSGTGPCPDATAELTVTEVVAPDAGNNTTITVCSSDGAFSLIDSLQGTPGAVGQWTDPDLNAHSGTFFPGSDPGGPYIYTVAGTIPCGDDVAVLNVNVNTPPNAGSPTSVTLCSNDGPVLLLSYLVGADPSGTWSDDGGMMVSGFFDPASDQPGVYTYTVDGDDPCASSSTTVTVFVNDEADAGISNSITVCTNSGTINLFNQLGGSPQNNGTWSGPLGPHSGFFQSSTDPAGDYTYTVPGVAPCAGSSAIITVTVDPQPNPGIGTTAIICSDTNAFSILDLLGGTPDVGGTWMGPAQASNGVFIPNGPNASDPGVYTYTVSGTGLCSDASASVTIIVNQAANAGGGTIIDVCDNDGSVNLFSVLTGSPDVGGTWKNPFGAPHSGTFVPSTQAGGDYVYTVSASSPCQVDSAVVTVNLDLSPDAGQSGVHTTCDDANPFSLITHLGGAPDVNGFWLNPDSSISNGIFLPGLSQTGVYTYTVLGSGACDNDVSNLTMIENAAPDAGDNTTEILCSTVGTISLVDYLDGAPDAGGDWFGPGFTPSNGLFVPGTSPNGEYTYIIEATAPCSADTAVLDLTVTIAPDAGIPTAVVVCDTDPTLFLTDLLLGTPDTIGNWFGPDSLLHGPFFDPSSDPSGTYTYYVVGGLPCTDASSTVQMTVVDAPFAGGSASLTTCVSDPAFNLAAGLPNADLGGTWEDVNNTGALGGSVVDATLLSPGLYDFLYIVPGTAPCGADTAEVLLEVTSALNAGSDSLSVACLGDPAINLFMLLGPDAQPGGTWTDNDMSGDPNVVSTGVFTPSSVPSNTIWSFTYTLPGVATCVGDSSTIVVQVIEGPYAGEDGFISVCETASPFSMFSVISGEDSAGVWFNSTWDVVGDSIYPATDTSDVFAYVVDGVGSCPPDTAFATVEISTAPNAGDPFTAIEVCTSDFSFLMIDSLGGNPDLNGGWAIQGCTVPVGATFSPALSPPGQYCYIVPGIGSCPPTQAILDISVASAPDAGMDGQVSVCSIDGNVNLFFELVGSPDFGGTWIGPDLLPHSGILDPAVDTSGTYAYVVAGIGGCEDDTAVVDVEVYLTPNAGISATVDTCALIPSLNLFDFLGGDPDTTGIWIPQNGGTVVGDSLIVSGLAIGVYDFEYLVVGAGACADSVAVVTVDFTTGGANAGSDGALSVCSTQDTLDLSTILIGPADPGGTWDITTGNPGYLEDSLLCISCLPLDSVFTLFYVVVEPGCGQDTAFIDINVVEGPDLGTSVTINICEDEPTFNIFDQLGGDPDTTGFWVGPLGNIVSPVFEPGVSKEGPYYYIIAPLPPCTIDTAVVFIEEWEYPDAGFDATVSGCAGPVSLDLFGWLGTNDTSGTWLDLDNTGNLTGSLFSFDGISGGAYDVQYVASNPGCGSDTSDLIVRVIEGISVQNLTFDCDMDTWSYSASFEIVNGDSTSYNVSGDMGQLVPGSPYVYYTDSYLLYDSLNLIVSDAFGCGTFLLDTVSACDFGELVFVPESFSPNNDGINDYLEILGIEGFPDNVIHIYNRWGDLIYNRAGYDNRSVRWDGSSVDALMGSEAPAGTYYYVLDLGIDGADVVKGYVYLNK